jgi:hypothetical protein
MMQGMLFTEAKEPKEGTDNHRVLEKLRERRFDYVCGTHFLQLFIKDYAQRIHDLKNMGHRIESAYCKEHPYWNHGHKGNVAMYSLKEFKEAPF